MPEYDVSHVYIGAIQTAHLQLANICSIQSGYELSFAYSGHVRGHLRQILS